MHSNVPEMSSSYQWRLKITCAHQQRCHFKSLIISYFIIELSIVMKTTFLTHWNASKVSNFTYSTLEESYVVSEVMAYTGSYLREGLPVFLFLSETPPEVIDFTDSEGGGLAHMPPHTPPLYTYLRKLNPKK